MNYLQCESVDDDEISMIEKELFMMPGPTLADIFVENNQPQIIPFTSATVIRSIEGQKDILYIGNQHIDVIRAFNFILLRIGIQQKKNYPHLNTHIKEQFYRPNMFISEEQSSQEVGFTSNCLELCQKYFEEVRQIQHVQKFFLQNSQFQTACLFMLKKIVEQSIRKEPQFNKLVLVLCKKFHIDVRQADLGQAQPLYNKCQVYIIGSEQRFLLIKQCSYVFVVLVGGNTEQENQFEDDRLQSDRSGQSGLQNVIEVSDESTPKFKESEVAKYRRKSHKNSFGGDLDVVNYRDLQNPSKNIRPSKKKVLSEHFQVQQMGSLCHDKIDQQVQAQNQFNQKQTKRNLYKKLSIQMKTSNIQPQTQNILQEQIIQSPKLRHFASNTSKKSNGRQRKIATSQIIEFKQFDNVMSFSKHDKERIQFKQNEGQQLEAGLSRNTSQKSIGQNQKYLQNKATHLKGSILIPNAQLQRIQERQSSQRQSTHPDNTTSQSNELTSDAIIDLLQSSIQKNLKDRKYSYFTQQMASSKSRKSKQRAVDLKVNRKGKNDHAHKNSEVINGFNGFGKRRFQQNPLRFSQLGNQITGLQADQLIANSNSQFSVLSNSGNRNPSNQLPAKSKQNKNKLISNVLSFANARHCPNQPLGWIKKQTIFYFSNKRPEKLIVQKVKKILNQNNPKQNLKTQPQPNLCGINKKSNKSLDCQRKNSYEPQTTLTQAPRLSKKNSNTCNKQIVAVLTNGNSKQNANICINNMSMNMRLNSNINSNLNVYGNYINLTPSQVQSFLPKSQTSLSSANQYKTLNSQINSTYRPVSQQLNHFNNSVISSRKQSYDLIQADNRSMKNVFMANHNLNSNKQQNYVPYSQVQISQNYPFNMLKSNQKIEYRNQTSQNPQRKKSFNQQSVSSTSQKIADIQTQRPPTNYQHTGSYPRPVQSIQQQSYYNKFQPRINSNTSPNYANHANQANQANQSQNQIKAKYSINQHLNAHKYPYNFNQKAGIKDQTSLNQQIHQEYRPASTSTSISNLYAQNLQHSPQFSQNTYYRNGNVNANYFRSS